MFLQHQYCISVATRACGQRYLLEVRGDGGYGRISCPLHAHHYSFGKVSMSATEAAVAPRAAESEMSTRQVRDVRVEVAVIGIGGWFYRCLVDWVSTVTLRRDVCAADSDLSKLAMLKVRSTYTGTTQRNLKRCNTSSSIISRTNLSTI